MSVDFMIDLKKTIEDFIRVAPNVSTMLTPYLGELDKCINALKNNNDENK